MHHRSTARGTRETGMADLERLAVKRDRGFLVRLVLLLCVGLCASVVVFVAVTGKRTTSCMASTLLGQEPGAAGAPATPDPRD
jgi:hypothetical protein